MSINQRPLPFLLACCWLVMQTQVLASAFFGCGHEEARLSASIDMACPAHAGNASVKIRPLETDGERLLDCQSCALHCLIGTPALVTAAPVLPEQSGRAVQVAATLRHSASWAPDSLYRPPIS